MQAVNDWSLPLFIHQEEPLLVYVVNNKVLRFHVYYMYDRSYTKAFYFLHLMNNDSNTDFIFPNKLGDYLHEGLKPRSVLGYPLIGIREYTTDNLDLELIIKPNEQFPIILQDIKQHTNVLDDHISLSARDAFFLFANICTNARCEWFRKILHQEGSLEFNIPVLKQAIRDDITDNEKINPDKRITASAAYSFMLAYLTYLKEQLHANTISLEYLLKLSGTRLLAFLAEFEPNIVPICSILDTLSKQPKLHINEKIVYYSLFELYNSGINYWRKDSDLANKFNQLLKQKRSFVNGLQRDIKSKLKF